VLVLAQKDPHGAIDSFKKCSVTFDYCRMTLADAQEQAGETAAAADTRTAIMKANHRDPEYWFVRARVAEKMKVPSM